MFFLLDSLFPQVGRQASHLFHMGVLPLQYLGNEHLLKPTIDFLSFICLLSQWPHDGALANYFFEIQTFPCENEWIIFRYTKEKFPREHHMICNGQFTYITCKKFWMFYFRRLIFGHIFSQFGQILDKDFGHFLKTLLKPTKLELNCKNVP